MKKSPLIELLSAHYASNARVLTRYNKQPLEEKADGGEMVELSEIKMVVVDYVVPREDLELDLDQPLLDQFEPVSFTLRALRIHAVYSAKKVERHITKEELAGKLLHEDPGARMCHNVEQVFNDGCFPLRYRHALNKLKATIEHVVGQGRALIACSPSVYNNCVGFFIEHAGEKIILQVLE